MLQEDNVVYELWDIRVGVMMHRTKSRGEMFSLVNLILKHHGPGEADNLMLFLPNFIKMTGESLKAWARTKNTPRTR